MDAAAEQVKLLLAEKAYMEQRITANIDLQQKVIAAGLTAVIAALGWVFSAKVDLPLNSLVMILLSLVSISALSLLMAVIYGGFALAAISFKQEVLGAALQKLLETHEILNALKAARTGPAGRSIELATGSLCLAHGGLNVAVYFGAVVARLSSAGMGLDWPFAVGAVVAGALLVGSLLSLVSLIRASRRFQRG
jgi:hypothetical protein